MVLSVSLVFLGYKGLKVRTWRNIYGALKSFIPFWISDFDADAVDDNDAVNGNDDQKEDTLKQETGRYSRKLQQDNSINFMSTPILFFGCSQNAKIKRRILLLKRGSKAKGWNCC